MSKGINFWSGTLETPHDPIGNRMPIDIHLFNTVISSDTPAKTVVGTFSTFDPDEGDTFTYTLLDDANGLFDVVNNELVMVGTCVAGSVSIAVEAKDSGGLAIRRNFNITIKDAGDTSGGGTGGDDTGGGQPPVNHDPIFLSLSGNTVVEHAPTTSAIGFFSAWDSDGDLLTYELADDAGGRFKLHGNMLVVADGSKLDHATAESHQIKVLVKDGRGGVAEETFDILVKDIGDNDGGTQQNHRPVDVLLSNSVVGKDAPADTVVGILNAVDPNVGETFTYKLLDDANGLFKIVNNELVLTGSGHGDIAHILVQVVDSGGLTLERTFTIAFKDAGDTSGGGTGGDDTGGGQPPENHDPLPMSLSGNIVAEHAPNTSAIGFFSSWDQDGDMLTYELVDDAGGRFKLHDNMLVVADGAKLDRATAESHQIKVLVKDGRGGVTEGNFTILVKAVGGSNPENDDSKPEGEIRGGNGNDRLSGSTGDDILAGGLGKDVLTGSAGKDAFVLDAKLGKSNVDRITDFSVKDDTIQLAQSVFKGIGKKGVLTKGAFWTGTEAHDTNDRIIYDAKSGNVYFDADGNGAKAAVKVANIGSGLDNLKNTDFFIV